MSGNDTIILNQIIDQSHGEIAPELPKPEFFELFVAEQILKDSDLSFEELQDGIVGSGGDGGIDGFYLFANGELVREDTEVDQLKKNVHLELYVIQSKTSPSFKEDAIDKLNMLVGDILDLGRDFSTLSSVYNSDLLAKADVFRRAYQELASRFPVLVIKFFYASKGDQVHPNVERKAEILKGKVRGLFSSASAEFEFLTASKLLALARRQPATTYNLSLAEIPISSTGDVGYIALVKLVDYYKFITDTSGKLLKILFEANVRDYQGDTEVNAEIHNSLKSGGQEDFWWLNNGVTIVAAKATQSSKTLTIEDPRIVNGLQTSTEIFKHFQDTSTAAEGRNLLVRVIVPAKSDSRDKIIKATNSQTYIPPASLRATDKIHRDIEEYLRPFGFYYDRRKNSHKNEGRPLDKIVSISLLSQAVMAIVLRRPDTARAKPSSMLKKNDDYQKLFDKSFPIDIYRFCIHTVKGVDDRMRDMVASAKDRANMRFHASFYAAALATGKSSPTVQNISSTPLEKLTGEIITESIEAVRFHYERHGASDQAAKSYPLVEAIRDELDARCVG